MCGIVGYIGSAEAVEFLITGLRRLEYRGYDSAGIATIGSDHRLALAKSVGRIDCLEQQIIENPTRGTIGIGHTRWATHGSPSVPNAHPHLGGDGVVAIVHNGVIENFAAEWAPGWIGQPMKFALMMKLLKSARRTPASTSDHRLNNSLFQLLSLSSMTLRIASR